MELRAHRAVHGADATLGPYGPYRTWPPKQNVEDGEEKVPGAPMCETITDEGVHADPVTGENLDPLQHDGSPRDPATKPNSEV
jgi:hypothetical protein